MIQDNISTPDTAPTQNQARFDAFRTSNDFHAAEVRVLWQWQRCNWSLDLLGKLAVGNNRQRISISGGTETPIGVMPAPPDRGLLAQPSNIGEYEFDDFTMVPELGATLGYQLTCNARFTIGYTLIYWGRVSRPGEQIDPTVNLDFIRTDLGGIIAGAVAPRFVATDTDFWLQGLNLGVDTRW